MNEHQQLVNQGSQSYEGDDVRADDEHQAAGTDDRAAEEGKEGLPLGTIDFCYDIFCSRDPDGMQDIRDDEGIDAIQRYGRQDVRRWHHVGIDPDEGCRNAAHGHHGQRQVTLGFHLLELQRRNGQSLRIAQKHHFNSKKGLEFRRTRNERQPLADPFDDKGQDADVGQDVKKRYNHDDGQQGRREEIHLLHTDPVGESKGDPFISDIDEPDKGCGRTGYDFPANGKGRQEPGDKEIEEQQYSYAAPLDLLAFLGKEDAQGQKDQNAEQIDCEKHVFLLILKMLRGPLRKTRMAAVPLR